MEIQNIDFDKLTPVITGFFVVSGTGFIILIAQFEILQAIVVFAVGALILIFVGYVGMSVGFKFLERHNQIMLSKEQMIRLYESGAVHQITDCRAQIRPAQPTPELLSFSERQHFAESGKMLDISDYQEPTALDMAVKKCDSCMIWGGKGCGKSNFAFHYADALLCEGKQVFVIDPKMQYPGKWQGCRVIGGNENFKEIKAFLKAFTAKIKDDRVETVVIIDEIRFLNRSIKGFSDLWIAIAEIGREYGKFITIISQSKTAASLGLKGNYDMMECFDAIIQAERDGAEHYALIEQSGNEKPVRFAVPGEHQASRNKPRTERKPFGVEQTSEVENESIKEI